MQDWSPICPFLLSDLALVSESAVLVSVDLLWILRISETSETSCESETRNYDFSVRAQEAWLACGLVWCAERASDLSWPC